MKTSTDRNGSVTFFAYDPKGHLTEERITVSDGGASPTYVTIHSYLPNGDRSSTTDSRGNTTRFSHDVYGNLSEVRDARGGVTTTSYNERSLPVEQSDALDRVTTFAYDTLGRLTAKTLPKAAGEAANPVETTVYEDSDQPGDPHRRRRTLDADHDRSPGPRDRDRRPRGRRQGLRVRPCRQQDPREQLERRGHPARRHRFPTTTRGVSSGARSRWAASPSTPTTRWATSRRRRSGPLTAPWSRG